MSYPKHKEKRKRDLHYLDKNGSVACNPRDKEAMHRAAVEGIATEKIMLITCKKCQQIVYRKRG